MIATRLFEGTRNLGTYYHKTDAGEEFEFHQCGECGLTWAMPAWFVDARRDDHRTWQCPNGHGYHFSGPSEKERLQAELKRTKDRLATTTARADQTEASLRATKGVVTKQRKKLEKVVAGVCPVDGCKRHFRDLRRHIQTKHPDYQGGR